MPKPKTKNVDWAADQYFDPNRVMVYIEHTEECPVFKAKAMEVGHFFQSHLPEKIVQLVRNQNGKLTPRPGAFEIQLSQNARTSLYDLWSGIDKGPPRREKIPKDYAIMLPAVEKIMKKIYVKAAKIEDDLNKKRDEDEDMDDDMMY